MSGKFGPGWAVLWNAYVIGVYTLAHDLWIIALGTIAIRRVQRIPWPAAALIMLGGYGLWMYGLMATVAR
jgi:hypothetical protein